METLELLAEPKAITPAPVARTEVATAAAGAVDLTKVRLADVALAQFGDWRAQVKAANTALKGVVHDLSTVAKIGEAKSLRWRLIGQPVADARKVSKAVKSELTAVSKTVGTAEESIVAALEAEAAHITPQIDAAEKRIADEKAERERIAAEDAQRETERIAAHRANIAKIKGYIAQASGATAAKLQVAIDFLAGVPIGDDYQEFQAEAEAARDDTLLTLENMLETAEQKEEHERQVKAQAIENARVAAEQAAERQRLADERAELARQQQELEAAQARAAAPVAAEAIADAPDSAARTVENPGHTPEATPVFIERPMPTGEGKAGTPDAGNAETAPNYEAQHPQQVLKAEPATADATDRGNAVIPSPDGGPMGAGQAAAAAPLEAQLAGPLAALLAHIDATNTGRFRSHPKVGPEWWATLRKCADLVKERS